LHLRGARFSPWLGYKQSRLRFSMVFPSPAIIPWPPHTTSYQIHHSQIIIPFNAIQSMLLTGLIIK
jgi:hypothetical protein